MVGCGRRRRSGSFRSHPPPRIAASRCDACALELGALEAVLLELLGDAPPRQAAVPGATRDVSLVHARAAGRSTRARPGRSGRRSGRAAGGRCRSGSCRGAGARSRGATDSGRSSRRSTEPSARATPALMAFSSSRMFPGQVCRNRACIASEAISVNSVPVRDRCCWRKCMASSGMSSVRSRKRGQVDPDHVEAVEQIGAEPALLDLLLQDLVAGRDDPDVDLDRLGPPDALELARSGARGAAWPGARAGCRPPRRAAGSRRRPARTGRSSAARRP